MTDLDFDAMLLTNEQILDVTELVRQSRGKDLGEKVTSAEIVAVYLAIREAQRDKTLRMMVQWLGQKYIEYDGDDEGIYVSDIKDDLESGMEAAGIPTDP